MIIKIQNDGSGTKEMGNYDCSVSVNDKELWHGRLEGHDRSVPWQELILKMVLQGIADENDPSKLMLLHASAESLGEFTAALSGSINDRDIL